LIYRHVHRGTEEKGAETLTFEVGVSVGDDDDEVFVHLSLLICVYKCFFLRFDGDVPLVSSGSCADKKMYSTFRTFWNYYYSIESSFAAFLDKIDEEGCICDKSQNTPCSL